MYIHLLSSSGVTRILLCDTVLECSRTCVLEEVDDIYTSLHAGPSLQHVDLLRHGVVAHGMHFDLRDDLWEEREGLRREGERRENGRGRNM